MAEDDGEVEVALQWNTGYNEGLHGFANGIATDRGRHPRRGTEKGPDQCRQQVRPHPEHVEGKGREPAGRGHPRGDVRHRLGQARDPQFEGQTKAKLGNTSMRSLVERATNEKLAEWLEENPTEGRLIVTKAIQASRAPCGGPRCAGGHPAQVPARGRRHARQAHGLPHPRRP